ncbi:MAG: ATP-binding cassette domain-containing protein [Synergistaceae bacterium]|jgi:peptide/nickel transport system ATP-binding protein|nr:ATP-binding cassette domain-containing protein [Synergistaceae bacterium]
MATLAAAKNLRKFFKTPRGLLHAVDGVDVEIEEGTTLGVVGESGCGKSTLGRLMLRLIEPTSGDIFFAGDNICRYDAGKMKKMRTKMQIIFQDPYSSLNPRMSVSQIIAEPIVSNSLIKDPRKINERVEELMDTVGMARRFINSYPHELDGGRRQRIGVARALAVEPSFIVCDEPVSALDVSIQAQILNLMMDLQDSMGLTYMFITHDLSVVKHISDEIVVMYLGQCVERVRSGELFRNPLHPYTKALLAAIPVPDLRFRGKKRDILSGEVRSPIDPPPGCRFAPRCRSVSEKCLESGISLKEVEKGHHVACSLYG